MCCEYEEKIRSNNGGKIGIDVGLKEFYTDSNGTVVDNPKHLVRYDKKFLKEHIDLESESAKKAGLTAEDLKDQTVNGKKETFVDMLDRLDEFVRFTGDELLDDKVKEALKNGINVTNIFI